MKYFPGTRIRETKYERRFEWLVFYLITTQHNILSCRTREIHIWIPNIISDVSPRELRTLNIFYVRHAFWIVNVDELTLTELRKRCLQQTTNMVRQALPQEVLLRQNVWCKRKRSSCDANGKGHQRWRNKAELRTYITKAIQFNPDPLQSTIAFITHLAIMPM